MKQNIFQKITIFLFCLSIIACKKEPGPAVVKPINEVGLTFADTAFVINQLDVLKVNPQIYETMSNNALKYEWAAYYSDYRSGVVNKVILLSNQKDLNKQITFAPGNYYLQYKVTDTVTGVSSAKRYPLKVNGSFYEGWLVANIKSGKSQLSFIRADDKTFDNPFESVNSMPLEGNLLSAYSAVIANLHQINIFTTKETYLVDADDFGLLGKSADLFEMPFVNSNPVYGYNLVNTDQYIVNNGDLYTTITPGISTPPNIPGKYSLKLPAADSYSLFPGYMALNTGGKYNVFYDNLNKRFVYVAPGTRMVVRFPSTTTTAFNMDNVGKEMVAFDYGPQRTDLTGKPDEYFVVMKDNTGYYIYTVLATASGVGTKQNFTAPDLSQATLFAMSAKLKHLYYAANNKIYLYDIAANSTRLVYQFPAGTMIRDLEMFKAKGKRYYTTPTDPLFNNRIVAATYNGTEGEVYYFDLMPTGDILNNTFSKKFGGYGDILQINYRNPNE